MVDPTLLTRAIQLSPADRLELIGELWQTLDPDLLPVNDADRDLLDDRLHDLAANSDSARSWEEVDADLRRSLSRAQITHEKPSSDD